MLGNKRILFFIILFIAISLRLFYLDKGYNSDEGWLLRRAGLDLKELIPLLNKGRNVYPPLPTFFLHFWLKLNNNEVWVRSYFVIFGIALCVLIYKLGKFYLDERFGLISFFISAISPLLIWSSQFIRSYIDSAFWAVLSIYFMLKMLRGKSFFMNGLGYFISSAFALYFSYLNTLILLTQNIFVFIFHFKDLKFLRKWAILQILVGIIFLPGVYLLMQQLNFASAIDPKWSERGFQLFGLNLGYHARSVVATLGMDPAFLTAGALSQKSNKIILSALAVLSFSIIFWICFTALKNLKLIFKDKEIIWFFPFTSVFALILYDILVEVKNFPLQAEYFVTQHALFIFVVSMAVYAAKIKGKFNLLALALISFVFVFRLPEAVKPEFETKKAYNYLVRNVSTYDCLLMVRNTNRYIDPKTFNIAIMYDYIHKDSDADYYLPLNEKAKTTLSGLKGRYKDIWFYRAYGNDEILGANKLIMDWLKGNGYIIKSVRKFRRIDIVHFEGGKIK